MAHTFLGRTGVRVSRLALGAMNLGKRTEQTHDDGIRLVHQALDAGINFIDTADIYSKGESEAIVGKALSGGKRESVVLATKFYRKVGDDQNNQGNSRRWIFQAVEDSLRRLNTDYIDIYQAHRPDLHTDIAETLSALTDLVRQGKIRYFGTSGFPGHLLTEAQFVAQTRGFERPSTDQPPYSILVRTAEREALSAAVRHNIGVLSYSPLAAGWLSEKSLDEGASIPSGARAATAAEKFDQSIEGNVRKREAVVALAKVAGEAGTTLPQLAIAFVLRHPGITSAILGPRTPEQLSALLGADDIELDPQVWDRIDEIVPPGTVFRPEEDPYNPPPRDAVLASARILR